MLSLEQAGEKILSQVSPLAPESIRISEAAYRYLRQAVVSAVDLPGFDNSAMDGYAVVAEDLAEAEPENPKTLRVAGKVGAGTVYGGEARRGECVRIFTGSPLPPGTDAVVMQEDVETPAGNTAVFREPVKPLENVRLRGEDVRAGTTLAEAGQSVTFPLAGLLAACGAGDVEVGRAPRIALLATGSELREPGMGLAAGQIYESNRTMLAGAVREAGGIPRIVPLVKDNLEETKRAVCAALEESDGVITTGGVSVGEFDFVKEAIGQLGGSLAFWKVAIKPGKPFVFGKCHDVPVFGLPGNPVSALVTFLLLVRPALLRMQGARNCMLPRMRGKLAEPLTNRGDRRHFVRVRLDANGEVKPAGPQASHRLGALGGANGLVEVAPNETLPAGETVPVLSWDLPRD